MKSGKKTNPKEQSVLQIMRNLLIRLSLGVAFLFLCGFLIGELLIFNGDRAYARRSYSGGDDFTDKSVKNFCLQVRWAWAFKPIPKYDTETEKRIDELFEKKERQNIAHAEWKSFRGNSQLFKITLQNTGQSGLAASNNFIGIVNSSGDVKEYVKFITRKEANIFPYDDLILRLAWW